MFFYPKLKILAHQARFTFHARCPRHSNSLRLNFNVKMIHHGENLRGASKSMRASSVPDDHFWEEN